METRQVAAKPPQVAAKPPRMPGPPRNADRTRAEILDVATAQFARHGFAGARVDDIAALTRTTKRMIYYYFGSKEQLYIAVLQRAFTILRPSGALPARAGEEPLATVRRIAELTFERHQGHPDLTRLIITENIRGGSYLAAVDEVSTFVAAEIALLERALIDGAALRVIRPGVRARDVLTIIDALCQSGVANRHTYQRRFASDPLASGDGRLLTDVLTAYLAPLA